MKMLRTIIYIILLIASFWFGKVITDKRCDMYINDIEENCIDMLSNPHNCITVCNKQCKWVD